MPETFEPAPGLTNRLQDPVHLLSYTAVRQRFAECPLQEGLMRLGVPRVPKTRRDFLVGDVLHDCMEKSLERRLVFTGAEVAAVFDRHAEKPGLLWRSGRDREAQLMRAWGTYMLIFPRVAQLIAGADEVLLEVDLSVPGRRVDYVLTAKLDLLIRHGIHWLVVDYKSSFRGGGDAQAHWYREVVTQHLDASPERVKVGYLWPAEDGSLKERWVDYDQDASRAIYHEAETVATALTLGQLEAKPDLYKCGRCRVRISCASRAGSGHKGRAVG